MFKIVTWNVNSVKARLNHLTELVSEHDPDIILLQELKCEDDKFPQLELSHLPYNIYTNGQKSYNGVAVLSKIPADEVKIDFPGNNINDQARFIEVSLQTPIGYGKIISLYAPNGGEVGSDKFAIKLEFFDRLIAYFEQIKRQDEFIIVGSDFNIAPFDIDVYSPKKLADTTCFTLQERKKMRNLLNVGFDDCYRVIKPTGSEYSWWDYRAGSFEQNKGMRIDSIIATANVISSLSDVHIDYNARAKKTPSDHAPIIASFKSIVNKA